MPQVTRCDKAFERVIIGEIDKERTEIADELKKLTEEADHKRIRELRQKDLSLQAALSIINQITEKLGCK